MSFDSKTEALQVYSFHSGYVKSQEYYHVIYGYLLYKHTRNEKKTKEKVSESII